LDQGAIQSTATTVYDRSVSLADAQIGTQGVILSVSGGSGPQADELERRLLEFGLVEGSTVELLHEGPLAHDPIAIRIDGMRLALRRRDARHVLIGLAED
jgi:ferrous iron transport protein A